jgi:hypothetical protein
MKLPRWLMIAMLASSVLGALAAAGWWWVTWPERTIRSFVEFVSNGDDRRAAELLSPDLAESMKLETKWLVLAEEFRGKDRGLPSTFAEVTQSDIELRTRTWLDVVEGRLECRHYSRSCVELEFTISRDRIVDLWIEPGTRPGRRYQYIEWEEYRPLLETSEDLIALWKLQRAEAEATSETSNGAIESP